MIAQRCIHRRPQHPPRASAAADPFRDRPRCLAIALRHSSSPRTASDPLLNDWRGGDDVY